MGILDRLRDAFGGPQSGRTAGDGDAYPGSAVEGARSDDELALDRYRYLLRTAPPEAVEEVHAEAFAKLTPQQRRMVFEDLSRDAAAGDRPASDDPRALARSATRSELRRPGFLENTLGGSSAGGMRQGAGLGTMIGGSLLGTVAGVVIGSAIADMLLPGIGDLGAGFGDFGGDVAGRAQDFGSDASGGFDGGGFDGGGFDGGGFDNGGFGGGDFGGGGDF